MNDYYNINHVNDINEKLFILRSKKRNLERPIAIIYKEMDEINVQINKIIKKDSA